MSIWNDVSIARLVILILVLVLLIRIELRSTTRLRRLRSSLRAFYDGTRFARDLSDVNIAAGIAHEELDGEGDGEPPPEAQRCCSCTRISRSRSLISSS